MAKIYILNGVGADYLVESRNVVRAGWHGFLLSERCFLIPHLALGEIPASLYLIKK